MTRKVLPIVVLVAVVVVAGYLFIKDVTTTEEERVWSVIDSLISHLEGDSPQWNVLRIRDHLSDAYRHRGEDVGVAIDKQTAVAYIYRLKVSGSYSDFRVDIEEKKITVNGDTARVDLTGRVTAAKEGTPAERVEVMTARGWNRVMIDLAKEDGDWMVTGSERLRHTLTERNEGEREGVH